MNSSLGPTAVGKASYPAWDFRKIPRRRRFLS